MGVRSGRAIALTYAGAAPFVLCALGSAAGLAPLGLDLERLLLLYGAVIAAFVSGIHWGLELSGETPLDLLLTSNLCALAAWLAVGLLPAGAAALALAAVFAALLAIDRELAAAGAIEPWFWALRIEISAAVIAVLALWGLVALVR